MERTEIWATADFMREVYGPNAAVRAASLADRFMNLGNIEGFKMWEGVVMAIREIDRLGPREVEAKH